MSNGVRIWNYFGRMDAIIIKVKVYLKMICVGLAMTRLQHGGPSIINMSYNFVQSIGILSNSKQYVLFIKRLLKYCNQQCRRTLQITAIKFCCACNPISCVLNSMCFWYLQCESELRRWISNCVTLKKTIAKLMWKPWWLL